MTINKIKPDYLAGIFTLFIFIALTFYNWPLLENIDSYLYKAGSRLVNTEVQKNDAVTVINIDRKIIGKSPADNSSSYLNLAELTKRLTEKGVKVTGIDAWSWDRPLPFLAKEFMDTGDPQVIWEAHFAGIEIGYCHMEKMANLSAIGKPHGFKVCCFPVKIRGASAGWVRPVAIV